MIYVSTRGNSPPVGLDEGLNAGLSPDGGLYVPQALPQFNLGDFAGLTSLPEIAAHLLAPFFAGSRLQEQLPEICRAALSIPLQLNALRRDRQVLELFHGPTAAFKDFAARFLAECMARLRNPDDPPTTVLVATSGDTGAAVGAAFHRRDGFRVIILYPDGRVSPRQAQHLGAFGDNVLSFAVNGSFDDCQAMVKASFADRELRAQVRLAAANSISLGRLLPQISYYAWAALQLAAAGHEHTRWFIPTGNLGNGLAAILARRMGLPLHEIVLATNANPTLSEFFAGAQYRGRPSIATLANAMDVGAPSNAERLRHYFSDHELREQFRSVRIDDTQIRDTLVRVQHEYDYVACPHTACAFAAQAEMLSASGTDIMVGTAHPAKFPEVVEPLLGLTLTAPPELASWLERPSHAAPLANDAGALCEILLARS